MSNSAISNLPDLEALGQYLREVREGQRLKKETVAEQLHVRMAYLNALESGDWSALPGLAYGRGYLRRYAELLGLPQGEVMALCDRLQGKVSTKLNYFETASTEQQPSRTVLWLSLAAIVAMGTLWNALQSNDIEAIEADLSVPQSWLESKEAVPEVTPSPYSLPAQECMKIVQVISDPCYRVQEAKAVPMLAYQPITINP
jgi:cytoskeletal protein RodZ